MARAISEEVIRSPLPQMADIVILAENTPKIAVGEEDCS